MAISSVNNTSSTTAVSSKTKSEELNNRFTSMLIAQLQNQDPLSPMDTSQMTGQMASLEQLSQIADMNSSIKSLLSSMQSSSSNFDLVNVLGKNIYVSKSTYNAGDTLNFNLEYSGNYQLNIDGKNTQISLDKSNQTLDLSNYLTDKNNHTIKLIDTFGKEMNIGIAGNVKEVYPSTSQIKLNNGDVVASSAIQKIVS